MIERTSSDQEFEIADRIVACEAAGLAPAALAKGLGPLDRATMSHGNEAACGACAFCR